MGNCSITRPQHADKATMTSHKCDDQFCACNQTALDAAAASAMQKEYERKRQTLLGKKSKSPNSGANSNSGSSSARSTGKSPRRRNKSRDFNEDDPKYYTNEVLVQPQWK